MARYASRAAAVSHWNSTHKDNLLNDSDLHEVAQNLAKMPNGDFASGDSSEDAKKFLQDIIKKVEGLHAILITDRDGIPVIKVNTADTPDVVSKAGFLASLSLAVEQAGKLGSGRNKRIICMFSSFQVVLFNKSPLMITLIATSKANTGFLLNIESELNSFIEDLQTAIEENQSLI